jgi:hypothetical protein
MIVVVSPNLRRRMSTELTKATDGDLRAASGFSRWQSVLFHPSVQNSILECKNCQPFGECTSKKKSDDEHTCESMSSLPDDGLKSARRHNADEPIGSASPLSFRSQGHLLLALDKQSYVA